MNPPFDITSGADVNVTLNGTMAGGRWVATMNGTYIDSHRGRIFSGDPYVETAGQWDSRDLFPRWKHEARFTYTSGPWSAGRTCWSTLHSRSSGT